MFQLVITDLLFTVHPLTVDRWPDLVSLFGPNGAYWGCWCMYWRLQNKDFNACTSEDRKKGLKKLVESGYIPGLLAYEGNQPVGWMSISPKSSHPRLMKSRVIPLIDGKMDKVLSIVCFFIDKANSGRGISKSLLLASNKFALNQGYNIIEAYPVDNKGAQVSAEGAYVGLLGLFEQNGFSKVSETKSKSGGFPRVIVRKYLDD